MAKAGRISGKPRLRPEVERPLRHRRYQYLFLIVCEDEKTEPYYFGHFAAKIPPETLYLRPVGAGLDPLGVVQRAQTEQDRLATEFNRAVDETWVVFDKDDANLVPAKTVRFEQALALVKANGFNLAFSNEVFELWLLLHLADVDAAAPIPRAIIYTQLEQELRQYEAYSRFEYVHGKKDVVDAVLQVGNEEAAIQRAKALAAAHTGKPPLTANPSTHVYELVEALRSWIAYFRYEN